MSASLLEQLKSLETEMHLNSTRKNSARMNQLMHAEFTEIGRSGKTYTRAEILSELEDEAELPEIHAVDFEVQQLGDSLYLLTYVSAHVGKQLHRHSRRASLWIREDNRWQIRFHQGTPLSVNSK